MMLVCSSVEQVCFVSFVGIVVSSKRADLWESFKS